MASAAATPVLRAIIIPLEKTGSKNPTASPTSTNPRSAQYSERKVYSAVSQY